MDAAWNARGEAAPGKGPAPLVAVIARVGDQDIGLRQSGKQRISSEVVADLARRQMQGNGLAIAAVADRVELEGEGPASAASDAALEIPFLNRPAAVRRAPSDRIGCRG